MSPRTKKQFEEIRERRIESIKKVAFGLFANQGFKGTSIADIAKKAGISKGLIYNYFENKNDLVKSIIKDGFNDLLDSLQFDFTKPLTREDIIYLIDKNFKLIKEDTDFWRLYTAVITQPTVAELAKEDLYTILKPFIQSISAYYKSQGVSNPLAYGYLFAAILDGVGLDYMFDQDNYPLEDIKKLIIEKII